MTAFHEYCVWIRVHWAGPCFACEHMAVLIMSCHAMLCNLISIFPSRGRASFVEDLADHQKNRWSVVIVCGCVTCQDRCSINEGGDDLSMRLEHVIQCRRYRLVSMSQSFRKGFFHRSKVMRETSFAYRAADLDGASWRVRREERGGKKKGDIKSPSFCFFLGPSLLFDHPY